LPVGRRVERALVRDGEPEVDPQRYGNEHDHRHGSNASPAWPLRTREHAEQRVQPDEARQHDRREQVGHVPVGDERDRERAEPADHSGEEWRTYQSGTGAPYDHDDTAQSEQRQSRRRRRDGRRP